MTSRGLASLSRAYNDTPVRPDDEWMTRGACVGSDEPDLWFAAANGPQTAATLRRLEALPVCYGCPVRAECLAYALRMERGVHVLQRWGIWGGMTPWQRWEMAKLREVVA